MLCSAVRQGCVGTHASYAIVLHSMFLSAAVPKGEGYSPFPETSWGEDTADILNPHQVRC
jgi:hypothetical protein